MNARQKRDDAGFSLVELLISMTLFSVVLTIVGSVIVSALTAERTVREVTGSTTNGQLVVNVIEETVRNSTTIRVTPAADGVSTFATVRTTAGGTARCHAWFYDSTAQAVYERTSTSAIATPNPGAVGTEWTILSNGVVSTTSAGGATLPVFAIRGTRGMTVSFAVEGESRPTSLFITSVTGRAPLANASPQCF